jgi:hypothetical protein
MNPVSTLSVTLFKPPLGAPSTPLLIAASPFQDGAGAVRAMRRALEVSGAPPHLVAHVNAHATSTPLGDAAELHALRSVFGTHATRPGGLAVSATKGATGHLLGAAGAVETVRSNPRRERGGRSGLGGLTREVETPSPSSQVMQLKGWRRALLTSLTRLDSTARRAGVHGAGAADGSGAAHFEPADQLRDATPREQLGAANSTAAACRRLCAVQLVRIWRHERMRGAAERHGGLGRVALFWSSTDP